MRRMLMVLFLLLCIVGSAHAQADPPTLEAVEVAAGDGLALQGDFYRAPDGDGRAVLLMHMFGSSRGAWEPLLEPLVAAGYHVLNVDLRGHGATGGDNDWVLAQEDTQVWLAWLRAQDGVRADAVSLIGASIGSSLALVGCAADAQCVTVIALSPGLNFYDVATSDAITALADRSALLISAQFDRDSADAVKTLTTLSTGDLSVRLYPGSSHGTTLFTGRRRAALVALIVGWLDEKTPPPPQ